MEKIRVVVVEPQQKAKIVEIEKSLESYQKIVGGNIEMLCPFVDEVALICNEEGKLNHLELNRVLLHPETNEIYDIIAGTFFICAIPSDSEEFEGLTIEQAEKYVKMYMKPQTFYLTDNGVAFRM